MDPLNLVDPVVEIAGKAAVKIMQVYEDGNFTVEKKENLTPITEADILSNDLIVDALKQLTPGIPVLSEEDEQFDFETRKTWDLYWLVDPLDGTRDFIHRSGEFCINIALIQQHSPILAVIFSPVMKTCYTASVGNGAWFIGADGKKHAISVSSWPINDPIRVIVSNHARSKRIAPLCQFLGKHELIRCGSALKFCSIAEGSAEIYPRFGPISEWDTAAGQCILECAGGAVIDLNGQSLRYNTKKDLLQPSFLAVSDKKAACEILKEWR